MKASQFLLSRFARRSAGVLLVVSMAPPLFGQTTSRVSVGPGGVQGNNFSTCISLSAMSPDGRYVVFESAASNLVPGDTNGWPDTFLRDRLSGTTERVSLTSAGAQASDRSHASSISADGRYVAFLNLSSNLVPGDTNGRYDVFVRDRQAGVTERVSISSAGVQANWDCLAPTISADGRYVSFESAATNLVLGDTNAAADIFARDRLLGTTERVNVDSAGGQANSYSGTGSGDGVLSGDGRYAVFTSNASNLVPGDTNGFRDTFVRDRQLGTTERVSVDSAGAQGNNQSVQLQRASISADGRYVVFASLASNLVPGDTNAVSDIFLRDRQLGTTQRVSLDSAGVQGNNACGHAVISGNNRFVAFMSYASNLVVGDANGKADVFVRDLLSHTTELVSVDSFGAQGNELSGPQGPSISADGRFVSFESGASNLVPGDTNGNADVFIRDRTGGCASTPTSYCTAKLNSLACTPAISASGVASASAGSGFVVSATNMINNKSCLMFYGTTGPGNGAFQGGTLCVNPPVKRTPGTNTFGNPPPNDCSGAPAIDMNLFAVGGLGGTPLTALTVAGTVVNCQWGGRDPGFPSPNNAQLSDGLEYTICP